MIITICGSIAFYDKMEEVREYLEAQGHDVKLPPVEVKDEHGKMIPVKDYYAVRQAEENDSSWVWDRKEEAMRWHFDKIEASDAIIVLNYDKKGIKNYVGANTFLEMGLAMHLRKKIFLLNGIPEIPSKEEILGMKPIVINGNLDLI